MSILVSNGRSLIRKSSKLVRSPITIRLNPDQRLVYMVAGEYTTGTLAEPIGGFKSDYATMDIVKQVGKKAVDAYISPSSIWQVWRTVTNNHDPEAVWYQGSYSTSAKTQFLAYNGSEAYFQMAAYHFTMPQAVVGNKDIKASVRLSFTNGGAGLCYGSPLGGSSMNKHIKDVSYWDGDLNVCFGYTNSIGGNYYGFQSVSSLPCDAYSLYNNGYGAFRGGRELWGQAVAYDGGIPTLTTPSTATIDLTNTQSQFVGNGGGWIIPYFPARYTSGDPGYLPYFKTPERGTWMCGSVWGLTVELTID